VKNRNFYLTVVGGVLAIVVIAFAVGLVTDGDNGSTADWVAAIATVGALGAAVVAARYAAGAFDLEQGREERLFFERRSAQAALVAAWPEQFIPNREQEHDGSMTVVEGITGAVAMLRNASDIPVTNVHIDFTVVLAKADGRVAAEVRYLGGEDLAVLPPASEATEARWISAAGAVMIPGVPTLGDGMDYPHYGTYDPSHLIVDVTFRDAAGVLWHRDRVGRLVEVLETPGAVGRTRQI
jgi:hypothetical protein